MGLLRSQGFHSWMGPRTCRRDWTRAANSGDRVNSLPLRICVCATIKRNNVFIFPLTSQPSLRPSGSGSVPKPISSHHLPTNGVSPTFSRLCHHRQRRSSNSRSSNVYFIMQRHLEKLGRKVEGESTAATVFFGLGKRASISERVRACSSESSIYWPVVQGGGRRTASLERLPLPFCLPGGRCDAG